MPFKDYLTSPSRHREKRAERRRHEKKQSISGPIPLVYDQEAAVGLQPPRPAPAAPAGPQVMYPAHAPQIPHMWYPADAYGPEGWRPAPGYGYGHAQPSSPGFPRPMERVATYDSRPQSENHTYTPEEHTRLLEMRRNVAETSARFKEKLRREDEERHSGRMYASHGEHDHRQTDGDYLQEQQARQQAEAYDWQRKEEQRRREGKQRADGHHESRHEHRHEDRHGHRYEERRDRHHDHDHEHRHGRDYERHRKHDSEHRHEHRHEDRHRRNDEYGSQQYYGDSLHPPAPKAQEDISPVTLSDFAWSPELYSPVSPMSTEGPPMQQVSPQEPVFRQMYRDPRSYYGQGGSVGYNHDYGRGDRHESRDDRHHGSGSGSGSGSSRRHHR